VRVFCHYNLIYIITAQICHTYARGVNLAVINYAIITLINFIAISATRCARCARYCNTIPHFSPHLRINNWSPVGTSKRTVHLFTSVPSPPPPAPPRGDARSLRSPSLCVKRNYGSNGHVTLMSNLELGMPYARSKQAAIRGKRGKRGNLSAAE